MTFENHGILQMFCMKLKGYRRIKSYLFIFFFHFYPTEFTLNGVLPSLDSYIHHTYVRPKISLRFLVFWMITSVVFDDFFIFWKNYILGLPRPFSTIFFNIYWLTQRTLQVRWFMLEWFCLQILNLNSGTPLPFLFCRKKPSLALEIKLEIGDWWIVKKW